MDLRNDLGVLLKNSYKPQKDAKEEYKKLGYDYDHELSKMNSKVVVKNGVPTIIHRGSKTLQDWLDDGLLAFGLEHYSKRFKDAKELTKKVEEKYKTGANSIGHSLGGSLAEKSDAHGQIITYNKGSGLLDIGKKKNSKRQHDIRTEGDIVSLLNDTQKSNKQTIKNKKQSKNPFENIFNAHKTDNLFREPSNTDRLIKQEENETDLNSLLGSSIV